MKTFKKKPNLLQFLERHIMVSISRIKGALENKSLRLIEFSNFPTSSPIETSSSPSLSLWFFLKIWRTAV